MAQANPGTPERVRRGPEAIAAAALWLFGAIAAAVTVVAIVESYSNLLAFARDHGLSGWRLAMAPVAVDSFIIMGELLLFAALLLGWKGWEAYWLGGGMALWGFLLSVGGNVWHASSATPVDRLVAAIWPVTATAGLAGGLIIIKRVMAGAGKPDNIASPVGNPPAGQAPPPPAPPRREPRRAVTGQREARDTGPRPAAADPSLEQAVLTELLADPGLELPGWRELSREKFGTERSRPARRVLDLARAARNGGSHDDDS